jgi:methyltransferase-like protein/predicted O-methyltransferase YrrM
MTNTNDQQSYDELPYLVRSYVQSSPDRLATLARLHGLRTTPVTECRVLELGCAAGGNIIPLAQTLPESTFTGVDASARQIADGQAIIATVGLPNITLRRASILELDDDWGRFDYIIAHGIYSWVDESVREHILQICERNLAPNGVVYISYNTYPGWSVLGSIRDALLYHTRGIADPRDRATSARSLLSFLAEAEGDYSVFETRPMAMAARFFREKVDSLGPDGDTYLLHELLAEVNAPVYFSQFVDHAAEHGLQYLCEAQLSDTLLSAFPRPVAQAITSVATDPVDLGQYVDFLRDQTFRQTLLCHDTVSLDRMLDLDAVMGLYATSRAVPDSTEPELEAGSVEQFRDAKHNVAFATEHPVTKAALLHLSRVWPKAVAVDELLAVARDRLGAGGLDEDDAAVLSANLLRAYSYTKELASLHVFAPPVAAAAGARPVATPMARWQAERGNYVTNQYHEGVVVDPASRYLLPLLDGTRNHAALLEALAGFVEEDEASMDAHLTTTLAFLARSALLVG